jgi:lipopolysaccharide assembly protein A
MRWFNTIVIVALAAAMLIFAWQNFQSITVSFLGFSISAPLAVVAIIIYLLGMATGGSAWALMRWAWQGSRHPQATNA